MPGRAALLVVSLSIALTAGCDDNGTLVIPPAPDTVSVSFQDGVLPTAEYRGTADAVLKDGPNNALRNGNFGAAQSDTLGAVLLSSALYEHRLIVRMNLTSIRSCSLVLAANLSFHVIGPSSEVMTIESHRVDLASYADWIEGLGGLTAGVSWTTIDGGVPWTTGGGDFEGTALASVSFSGETTVTLPVPTTLVKAWILAPASNDGVVIKTTSISRERYAIVAARENGVPAWRPRLDITYIKGP